MPDGSEVAAAPAAVLADTPGVPPDLAAVLRVDTSSLLTPVLVAVQIAVLGWWRSAPVAAVPMPIRGPSPGSPGSPGTSRSTRWRVVARLPQHQLATAAS